MQQETTQKQPIYVIILLILAAEAVFILPFVLQRIFRPTFLETFAINNEDLGYCFSVYGTIALFSYLFGGPLADKFHPKITQHFLNRTSLKFSMAIGDLPPYFCFGLL
jgi:MFS family permease